MNADEFRGYMLGFIFYKFVLNRVGQQREFYRLFVEKGVDEET